MRTVAKGRDDATVLRLLEAATAVLARSGIERPRFEAEILLRYAMRLPDRALLYLEPERKPSPGARRRFFDFVTRRAAGEPLPYITGEKEFFSLMFYVTPDVLIPRPVTEHLVEACLRWLARQEKKRLAALDIGTGSGNIAVALAVNNPYLRVVATDIEHRALLVAKRNARRHRVATRVRFVCCDMVSAIKPDTRFDLVVSNPPYVTTAEYDSVPREVRREPKIAVFAGSDGLFFYQRILKEAAPLLAPDGLLALELNPKLTPDVKSLTREAGFSYIMTLPDLYGQTRVLLAHR